ncbi:uncharacterized protein LOC121866372 isoform X2 [Homarus americanus]|uniref:uncharacterized protein LOC121866372 isoform X2 n=1 Tax=Homarus americanus TaxID=6706 RepID=UPI001C470C97|nr:uncharacterized protein LOC121866372 isoform X2 [Homarus americanus]
MVNLHTGTYLQNEVCVVVKRDVEKAASASAAHLHPTQCSETSCAQKYKKSSITYASGSVPAMNEDKLTDPKGSGKKHPSKHFTKSSVCSLVLESDVQEITGPGSLDKYEMDTVEPAMALSTPVMNSFINTTSQDVLLLNMAMDSVEDNAGYNEKSNMSDVLQKKAVKTNVITVSEDDVVPCSLNTQEMKNLQTLKCATVFHPKSVISSELPSKFKGDSRNIHHSEHETNKATDTREAITGTQQKRCRRTKVTKKRTSVGEDDTQGVEDTSVHLTSVASSKSEKMLSHNNAELSSVISDSKKKGRKIPRNSSPVEATRVYYLRSRLRSQSADGTAQHSTDLKAKASCKSKKAFTSPKVSSPKYGYERSRRKTLEPDIIAVSPRDTDTIRLRTPRVDTMEPATPRADAMLPVATPRTDTMQPATPRADTMQPATSKTDTMQPAIPRCSTMQSAIPRANTKQSATPRANTKQSATPRADTMQPATPRSNTMQPTTPRANTMQPATPMAYTMQPTTPRSNTMQPTTPRSDTMQPTTPRSNTMQPTTPRSNTMQRTTPRADTMQPATPMAYTMQPTTPRSNTMQPTTPRSDTMQPTTPRSNTMQPTTPRSNTMQRITPRSNTMQPTTPRANAMHPATPRADTMQPATPRGGIMQPTTPRSDGLQFATSETCRADALQPSAPNATQDDALQHIGPDIINTYCSACPRIEVAQNVTLKIPLQVASLRSETSSHLTLKAKTMPTSTSNVDTLPVNSRGDDQQPDTSGALKSDTPHPVTDKPSSPISPSCDNPVDNTPRPGTPWPDKHRCHTPRPDTSWHGSHWPDIHRPHTPGLETTGKRDELPTTSLSNVCPDLMSSSLPFTPKSPPTRSRTCRIFSPKDSPIIDKDDLSLCLEDSSGVDIQKHDTDDGNPRKELDCQSSFEVDHSKSRELVLSREIQLFETLPATENTKIVEKDNQENTDLSIKDNGFTLHDKNDSSNYSIGVRNRKSPSKALETTLMILAGYPVKASYLTPVKVPYCTDISMLGSKSTGDVKKRERKMRRKSNSNLPLYKSSGKSTTFSYGLEERGVKTLRTKKKLFDTTSHSLLEGSPPHTSTPHEVYTFDEKDDASEVSPYSRQNENKVCRRKCQSVTKRNSEKSFFKNKRSSNSSRKIDERNDSSYETDKNDKMPENNTGSRLKNLNKSKTSEKERGKRPSQRNISAGGLFEDPQVVSMKSVIHDVYSDFDSPDQCIENSWFYNQKEGRKFEGSTYSMKRKSLSRLDLFDNRPEGDWKPFKERKKRISKELKGEVLKSHRKATVNKSRRKKQNSQSFAKHFSSTDRHSDIDTDNRSSRLEESSDLIIYEEGCKNAQNEALEILRHTSKSSVESNTQNVMEYKLFPSKAKDMDESQKRSRTDLEESFGFSSPELMAHQVKQPHTKRIRKSVEDKGIKSLVENILPQQQKPSSQMRPVVKPSDVPNPPHNTPVTDLSTQPFDTRDISVILSNRLNSQNVSSGRLQSTLIEEINHPNIPNERFSYVTELNSSYNSLPVDPSKSEMETQNSSLKDIQENDISPLLNKDISSKLDFDNSSEEGFQEPFEMIPKCSWMSLHEDSEESREDVSEKKNELTEDHLCHLENQASISTTNKPQISEKASDSQDHLQEKESTPVHPAPRTLFVTSKETLSEGQEKTAPTAQNSYCDSLQNIQTCIEHIADGLYRLASALKSHQTHHR